MSLAELVAPLQAKLQGPDVTFSSVSTDTRSLREGDLYVALQGERFDGNQFVGKAAEAGARAAIVSRFQPSSLPQLQVPDTTEALGRLGRLNRRRCSARVSALTGSQGKTTVKEMAGAILRRRGPTLTTRGNLNNAIGVPLTLLELRREHEFAVVELGANAAGEIAYAAALVEPDIVLLNNAAGTHLEGFGSLEGVVRAKGEIIEGVTEGGTVILNADDTAYRTWRARAGARRVVNFSLGGAVGADYHAENIRVSARGSEFTLCCPAGTADVSLPLLGRHNILNAIAATALAMEAGAGITEVVQALAAIAPIKGRLCPLRGRNGALLIDDSYNASPSSFRAAIDVLAGCSGTRVLVMGDMGELGEHGRREHQEVGDYAAKQHIDRLLTTGDLSRFAAEAFGAGGKHYASKDQLTGDCLSLVDSNTTILVKGSRSAGMDAVVEQLKTDEG